MTPPNTPPRPVDLAAESVAGEEDPGASIDLAQRDASRGSQPAAASGSTGAQAPGDAARPAGGQVPLNPGDEAAPGTPGTGEDLCRTCGGTGQLNGSACPDCGGTGKVTVGIGGA